MKKNFILTVFAFFFATLVSFAQEQKEYNMVITLKDGTVVTLGHNDIQNITFNDGKVSVSGDAMNTIQQLQDKTMLLEKYIAENDMNIQNLKANIMAVQEEAKMKAEEIKAEAEKMYTEMQYVAANSEAKIAAIQEQIQKTQARLGETQAALEASQARIKDEQAYIMAKITSIEVELSQLTAKTHDINARLEALEAAQK